MVQEVTRPGSHKMTRTMIIVVLLFPAMFCMLAYYKGQETGKRMSQPCTIGSRKNLSLASVMLGLLVRN